MENDIHLGTEICNITTDQKLSTKKHMLCYAMLCYIISYLCSYP
jgi:hypothetical protein